MTYAARFAETKRLVSATDSTMNLSMTNFSSTGYMRVTLNISRNVKMPSRYISL
jgi:hypothetical protein